MPTIKDVISILQTIDAQPPAVVPAELTPAQKAFDALAVARVRELGRLMSDDAHPPTAPVRGAFRLIDASNWSGKPGEQLPTAQNGNFWESGVVAGHEKGAYFYEQDIFGWSASKPRVIDGPLPDIAQIRKVFRERIVPSKAKVVVADIECYSWAFWVPDAAYQANIAKVATILQMFRQVSAEQGRPIELALYGYAPNNYPLPYISPNASPALQDQAARLPAIDAMLAPIVEVVDFLSPSLYPISTNAADHKVYVEGVMKAARAIAGGKPVYPHVWNRFYTSDGPGLALDREAPIEVWQQLIASVRQLADGWVLWGGNDLLDPNGKQRPFDAREAWYGALQAEIAKG